MFVETIRREMLLAFRNPFEYLNPIIFFVIVISLFPLGVSPAPDDLLAIAPGIFWVAALLATLLSLEQLFRSDFEDGSLEQMLVGRQPMLLIIMAKITSHWMLTGIPLLCISPLLGLMLYLPPGGIEALMVSLLVATPILSLFGAVGSSLVVGLNRGGLLISILILPVYVPVLILATAMVKTGIEGGNYAGHIYWLSALLALSLAMAPVATLAGVRISVSNR
ncbi:MAG: heme exporter protein CcmB [Gammaproteobacteria bacterium]|nr:heme exporter protein CcmB [Gammaproteobacteria bacterium]